MNKRQRAIAHRQRAIAKQLAERLPSISVAGFEAHASATMPRKTPQCRYSCAVLYLSRELGNVAFWNGRKRTDMVTVNVIPDACLDALCAALGAPHVPSVKPQLPQQCQRHCFRRCEEEEPK